MTTYIYATVKVKVPVSSYNDTASFADIREMAIKEGRAKIRRLIEKENGSIVGDEIEISGVHSVDRP